MGIIGSITLDEVSILEVDSDPSINGIDAPLSSIALLNDKNKGVGWLKTGPLITDWSSLAQNETIKLIDGGTPSTSFIYCFDGGTPSTMQEDTINGGKP